ncbi:MAG: TetR/AcrR family transcriptional regulator, partial [bacterium]
MIATVIWAAMAVKRKVRSAPGGRRTRVHGEESRERILEAAREIAGERGYDGTSIALVSERSGLPASSIYWHFEDKDHLLAAVIERSFNRWLEGIGAWMPATDGATRQERMRASLRRIAQALTEAPDFLRLGLMLALERRPEEATARTLFLQVREQSYKQLVTSYETFFEELDAKAVRALATLTMAAADGLFIRREVDGDSRAFEASFELLGAALLGAAGH